MCTSNKLKTCFQVAALLCCLNIAHAAEPPTEPILRIETGEHTAEVRGVATDKAGRWLVTASFDKTIRVWSLADGQLQTTLRIPIDTGTGGQMWAVALSPDGGTVAVGGLEISKDFNEGHYTHVYLFNRATAHLIRRMSLHTRFPNAVRSLAFSKDGLTLAASLSMTGVALFSVRDGRLLAHELDYASSSVDFSNDGRLVVACGGQLHLYHFDENGLTLLARQAAPGGRQPFSARFSPDGTRIAVGFDDSNAVNVLNASDLTLNYSPNTSDVNRSLESVAWSADGMTLFAAGVGYKKVNGEFRTFVRRWNMRTGESEDWSISNNRISALSALPNGQLAFSDIAPGWGVINASGTRQMYRPPVVADFRAIRESFSISKDATKILFAYSYGGQTRAVFDIQNRIFLSDETAGLSPAIHSAPGLEVTDWEYTTVPKLNGKALGNVRSNSFALLPNSNGVALGTQFSLSLYDSNGNKRWGLSSPGVTFGVNVSQDGRWVVAAYGDGTIRWHRASDGVEQLAFFPHADKKRWVMWTPSGYYDASPGAEDLIGWHVNRGKDHEADFFPASRFRERFYRPDVLTKVLETQDEVEAVRLANNESGRRTQSVTAIAQVLPPVVEIVSPAAESTVQPGTIKVRYTVRTAADADAPVTAMRVRVNGLLQSATRALKLLKNNDDTQDIEVTIPEPGAGVQSVTRALKRAGEGKGQESAAASSAQEVEIQLFAENKFSTSTPAILRLQYSGKAIAKQSVSSKPKLYVLAVGVSKYANPEYNLGLASKDANDFVNSLQGQKGKLYSDVVVKLLTDAQATKDDVLDGLDWLKQNVTQNDVGIMFVAGHGMNDKLGGYYFMPHNADPDKLARTGVSQSEIKQTFANLPGHTVFFIDTCYSGGAMGNVRTSGFVNDLASAENGAVVFTASSAGQLSQENSSWGNGAFTKSVVEGLNGKADAFNSGAVTVKGLDFYVDGRVKSLTNGQQTPVSIAPGGLSDFPIAIASGGKK